jgi:hypothetical protein
LVDLDRVRPHEVRDLGILGDARLAVAQLAVDGNVLERERRDATPQIGHRVVLADAHDDIEAADELRERARVHEHRLVALVVVRDQLRRIRHDVEVTAEDEIDAGERLLLERLVGIVDL